MRRGQTSTEYMIIVAVVIVIAVVVSSILGEFPGMSGSADKNIDDYKLTTAKVSVSDYASISNYSLIKIKNNHFDTLTATAVNVEGEDCGDSNLPVTLGIGKSFTLNCSVNFTGTPSVNIIWSDPSTGASYATGENLTSSDSGGGSSALIEITGYSAATNNLTATITGAYSENLTGDVSYMYNWYNTTILNATTKISSGLVAYVPFDNGVKDYAGAYDGNIYLTPTSVSGKVGNAYNFDANYEHVHLGDLENDMYTLAFWLYFGTEISSSTGAGYFMDYNEQGPSSATGGWVAFGACTGEVSGESLMIKGGSSGHPYYQTFIKDTIPVGWNHIAFVWDSSNSRYDIFVNSDSKTLFNAPDGHTPLADANNFTIGNIFHPGVTNDFSIDEFMIFNRSLSNTEVKQLYYGGLVGGSKLDSSLITTEDEWKVGFYSINASHSNSEVNSTSVTIG